MGRECYPCLRSDRYRCIRSGPRVKLERGAVGRGRTVHLGRDFTRVKLKPVGAAGKRLAGRRSWRRDGRAGSRGSGRPDRGDDLSDRDDLDRAERDRELLRLAARKVKEAGQQLILVLGSEHFRDLVHRREAEVAGPHRGLDLGNSVDELGRDDAVVGGALGELELPTEVGEGGAVAELAPAPLRVELGEGEKEVGKAAPLALEHGSHLVRLFTGSGHTRSVARDFRASPNAPGSLLTRKSDGGVATPRGQRADSHANRRRCEKHGSVSFAPRKSRSAEPASSIHCREKRVPIRGLTRSCGRVTERKQRVPPRAIVAEPQPRETGRHLPAVPRPVVALLVRRSRRTGSGHRNRSAAPRLLSSHPRSRSPDETGLLPRRRSPSCDER
jgi:hypothetical protein